MLSPLPLDGLALLLRRGDQVTLGLTRLFASVTTTAARRKRDCGVVSNAIDPRALGTIAAKARQRRPERPGDLLEQIVATRRIVHVGPGQTPQRRDIAP